MDSVEHQVPSCSYNPVGTYGEPNKLPRVGKKHQARLPHLLEDSNSYSYWSVDNADEEIRDDFLKSIHVGSPIKLAWTSSSRTSSGLKQSEANNIKKSQISFCEESESLPRLVPEKCDGDWTAAEKDSFLLGLYIFAKNFVEVRKLVGTKDTGALQSYYYETFYSSPEHHRWSQIRKMKHKKGALGRGIFSGQRLQEFLSRLLPRAGEYQNDLLEVSNSFENEKISLAEYVLSLKAMIGADLLVEAVGIDDASNALVHKKRKKDVQVSSQDQDQDQDQDMLPSTSSRAEEARLIDLNLPPDSEEGSIAAEASHKQDITSNGVEQSSSNPIRYSSRQRPPTTRVLEAFARGYLSVNRKRKRKDAASTDED